MPPILPVHVSMKRENESHPFLPRRMPPSLPSLINKGKLNAILFTRTNAIFSYRGKCQPFLPTLMPPFLSETNATFFFYQDKYHPFLPRHMLPFLPINVSIIRGPLKPVHPFFKQYKWHPFYRDMSQ